MARVIVADRQPIFREAICGLISDLIGPGGLPYLCEEAASIESIVEAAGDARDIAGIVVDFTMLGAAGLAMLVTLRSKLPAVPVIVTAAEFDQQRAGLCGTCGVAGCLAKTMLRSEMIAALSTVLRGGTHLPSFTSLPPPDDVFAPFARRPMIEDQDGGSFSFRQAAVLGLVTAGKSNKQIAWELSISETTVKAHMTAILRKLGVNSRAQAIVLLQYNPNRVATPN